MVTKFKSCIFLRKIGLDFFPQESNAVLSLEFPPTVVQDVEIISREELAKLLQNFITTQKLNPSRCIIILSESILFQKDIPTTKPEDMAQQKKLFLNNVPFEHVGSKEYTVDKATRVITTNADLYKDTQYVLEKLGFSVAAVVAPISFGKDFKMSERMNSEQGKVFIQKMDTIKPADNFLDQPHMLTTETVMYTQTSQKKKPAKSTLPVLLPVFGVLIAIFGIVFYTQSKQPTTYVARGAETVTQPQAIVASPTEAPAPILSPTVSAQSIISDYKNIKIQVLNGSGISGQAEKGKNQLVALGFENIKTGNADNLNTEKTLIVFKQSVSQPLRDILVAELKKTYQELTTQETSEGENDVVITLGHLIRTTPAVTP